MKIALAQLNPIVGDVDHNRRLIVKTIQRARDAGVDLVVFSELVICGYPPRDLLLVEGFVRECAETVKMIGEQHTRGIAVVIGTPLPIEVDAQGVDPSPEAHTHTANALVVYRDNAFVGYYDKRLLPTYDVFDEDRYFIA